MKDIWGLRFKKIAFFKSKITCPLTQIQIVTNLGSCNRQIGFTVFMWLRVKSLQYQDIIGYEFLKLSSDINTFRYFLSTVPLSSRQHSKCSVIKITIVRNIQSTSCLSLNKKNRVFLCWLSKIKYFCNFIDLMYTFSQVSY